MLTAVRVSIAVAAVTLLSQHDGLARRAPEAVESILLSQKLHPSAYSASASHFGTPPTRAFDGDFVAMWNAGTYATQWVEVDLQFVQRITRVRMVTAQSPAGQTTHEVWFSVDPIRGSTANATRVHTFSGYTTSEQVLEISFSEPRYARHVQIRTTQSPSWIAWREVQVFGEVPQEPWVIGLGRGGGEFQSWSNVAAALTRNRTTTFPWSSYNSYSGELHPATGDVDGDGLAELVIGLGRGGQGWIAIMDDALHSHALLRWVQVPWPSYAAANGTVWPAVGDIDGDGRDEIVAGLGTLGDGYFAIFDDAANAYSLIAWRRVPWAWYNEANGETRPAVANIDGGAFSEIVIGLGPSGGGWLEIVDDAESGFSHLRWLRVGWTDYVEGRGETYPAAGDVDGDGLDEIVVGLGPTGGGWLQVFDDAFAGLQHRAWLRVSWTTYASTIGETHPAVGNVDEDAADEIVLGLGECPGQGGWFEVRDDINHSFASLAWQTVGRVDFVNAGGATFPAIPRRRPPP